MGRIPPVVMIAGLIVSFIFVSITVAYSARDGGYDVTADLWARAVLKPASGDVTLVWQMVGAAITPSGAQVLSGYFYADPADFYYGSMYNPEVFVKIFIDPGGWCNIAFNHVTVDDVEVSSAHHYVGEGDRKLIGETIQMRLADGGVHSETITTRNRLIEHEYTGVDIDPSLTSSGQSDGTTVDSGGGYVLASNLWSKAMLQVPGNPITLIWKNVGSDTTPSGARVVSGYFYADPADFAYGSPYNPEVFVKLYIDPSGWANMAFNHVTVDDVTVYSAHKYAGYANQSDTTGLSDRLSEHQYNDVSVVTGDSYTNSLGMTFHLIPAGTFTMGSPGSELGRGTDETQHQVTLTQSYYMQTTEVTQGQWRAAMGSNPSYFSNCGDDCPVEKVSWNDIQSFITKMNQSGEGTYRLPTEAEWEYAARAGSTSAFSNGGITETMCGYDQSLDAMGWYCGNDSSTTSPVALKQPNAWGLYDMHGNVMEWCQDWYGVYPTGSVTDPVGPLTGSDRVRRGGSYNSIVELCRSADRGFANPGARLDSFGFRLVALPGQ